MSCFCGFVWQSFPLFAHVLIVNLYPVFKFSCLILSVGYLLKQLIETFDYPKWIWLSLFILNGSHINSLVKVIISEFISIVYTFVRISEVILNSL